MNNESLRISGIQPESIVDGPGLRFVIFTQGCPHQCPGCHNPETHDPKGGREVSLAELEQMILENPLLSGVTYSGGEPFLQPAPLLNLAERLSGKGLNLMIYTGYTFEELCSSSDTNIFNLLLAADILVDGPYLAAERDLELKFRGSRNQRLIRCRDSVLAGKILLAD